jgi:hypothetical protein
MINIIVITIALLSFIILTRPSIKQLLILETLVAAFWPLWMYLPSNKPQILHLAAALIIAGLFYRLKNAAKTQWIEAAILFLLIFSASILRVTWAILFIPYFLIVTPYKSWKSLISVLFLAVIPLAVSVFLLTYLSSPYYYDSPLFSYLNPISTDSEITIIDHISENLSRLFTLDHTYEIMVLLRFQTLFLCIWLLGQLVYKTIKEKNPISLPLKSLDFANLISLVAIFLTPIMIYEFHGTKDYRLFAPHILLALLLFILTNRTRLVWGVILTNLLFIPYFSNNFIHYRERNFYADTSLNYEFQEITESFLTYEPTENQWCNTIDVGESIKDEDTAPITLFLPKEFGITTLRRMYYTPDSIKAKYLHLDPNYVEHLYPYFFDAANLETLTQTPFGNLYLNLNSECK